MGYKLNSNNFLESHTTYGCQSDWPEMVRYTRKLKVSVIYSNDVACIKFGEEFHSKNIRKILNKKLLNDNIRKAKDLAIQGKFLAMTGIQIKASHSIIYNWNVSDKLVRFCLKARLNILPTEYTKFIWDKNNAPICRLCRAKPEYISHVVNGCSEFKNFYSRRHDRIVDKIADEVKSKYHPSGVYVNKMLETIFPHLHDQLKEIVHRKPDIVIKTDGIYYVLEVTVCYDTYFEYAYAEKVKRYNDVLQCLNRNGIQTKLLVMCFGSLGCIKSDVRNNLCFLKLDAGDIKCLLAWISISCIIGSNYIWRHRVKKLLQ